MGLFYALIHSPYVGDAPFQPYLVLLAKITSGMLWLLGQGTSSVESTVNSAEFSMQIIRGCDAIEPVAAFAAAVLASPLPARAKVPGVLVGMLVLLAINQVRLVSLFLVGVYFPSAFDFIHLDVWQAALIVLAVCCWAIWVQWAMRRTVSQRGGEV